MSESYKVVDGVLEITKTSEEVTKKTKEQLEAERVGLDGEINTAQNSLDELNARVKKIDEQLTLFPA